MQFGGALSIVCAAQPTGGRFQNAPLCGESWSNDPKNMPAVWIVGTSGPMLFQGLGIQYQGVGIRLGVDPTGNRTNGGAQGIHFNHMSLSDGGSAIGHGPQIDIGSNVFWVNFDDISATGSLEQWSVNLTRSNGTVTAQVIPGVSGTGGATHDLAVGDHVSIYANQAGDTSFIGTFKIASVPDPQHFTYSQPAQDAMLTGALAMGDKVFGMTVDPGTGPGSGLIEINRYTGTGIKFYGGNSGGSITVKDLTVEAPFILNPPGVWISGPNAGGFIQHVEIADTVGINPALVVDPEVNPNNVFAEFLATGITGSAYFGGFQYGGVTTPSGGLSNQKATPTRQGLFGFINGHVYGQQDAHRRAFAPTAVRFPNLAQFSSANWMLLPVGGTPTLTTGILAPDGTNGASQLSFAGGAGSTMSFSYHPGQFLPVTIAAGDWFIGGVWAQSQTGNGYENNAAGLYFQMTGANNFLSKPLGYNGAGQSSSQWEWLWFAYKVLGAGTPSTNVAMYSRANSSFTIQAYAPVLIHVPANTLSDNEAADLAEHLATYTSSGLSGDVMMLPGEYFRPGSTLFCNLGPVRNGTIIYCSDCTVSNPCSASGTGAFAKGLNGVWVCN
jgi:hypothetical protein